MLGLLASSATAGFGASFGRDLYYAGKKNPLVLGLVGALLLSFGWRNLFLGIGRGLVYRIFVTYLGSAAMIVVGGALVAMATMLVTAYSQNETAMWVAPTVVVVILSLVGIAWGRRDRAARRKRAQIEQRNVTFLNGLGFRDSGLDTDLVEDRDGNRLRVIEQTSQRIVFSVPGKRGHRAAIEIHDGEMVSYTGIVKVG